jgi:predicted nucleic acid-binding protein
LSGVYVDTSVLGRVLLGEPEAAAILRELAAFESRVASRLLRIELRRLALRHGLDSDATALVGAIAIVPFDDETLTRAETLPPASVATLDAIHLATAVRLAQAGLVDAVMTYDARLAGGAREHGLAVLAPV